MELKIKTLPVTANENCGLKCLKLIFGYYKSNFDNYDLSSKFRRLSSPVWITDLGSIALCFGFKVSIYSYSNRIFKPHWLLIEESHFKKILAQQKTSNTLLIQARRSVLNFIEAGGKFYREITTPASFKHYLRKRCPLILAVSSSIINQKPMEGGHFIIVNGYKGENFIILNPQRRMFKKEIIHQNRLFFALYQWGGWVMVLEKGKKFLS
ncbi:MAG: cysteine peptidase family C39 domain-containing protein [Candidatus Pacebacteria bacterium]|nr:cysteine peptidase family C39 domain-containing protein [Candidatus Paceibacterota bacterium]